MADLPDWYTQVQGVTLEASSFRSGLDADKPAAPAAGEIWLARDTKKLYVCHTAGSWDGFDASILIQGALTLFADLAGGGFELENIADPTAAQSAATRAYVLAQLLSYLALAGGTMSGAIAMGTKKITGMGDPTLAQDAATKTYVDVVDGKLDNVSQAAPSRLVDTIYQNSTKIRIITISIIAGADDQGRILVGSASPPTTEVARSGSTDPGADSNKYSMTAVILPNYYYELDQIEGAISIGSWIEWDLF